MRAKDCVSQVARLATSTNFAEASAVDEARATLDRYQDGKASAKHEDKLLKVLRRAQGHSDRTRRLMQVAMAPRMSQALQQQAWQAGLQAVEAHAGTKSNWAQARLETAAALAWTAQAEQEPSVRPWVARLDCALEAREQGALAQSYRELGELWSAADDAGDAHTVDWAHKLAGRWLAHDLNHAAALEALTDQIGSLGLPPQHPFWPLVHATAQDDRHTGFLAHALDTVLPSLAPPLLSTGPQLSRSRALETLSLRRWDVSGWTYHQGNDLFCLHVPAHAQPAAHIYEMNQTEANGVLGHLQNLADGHWQVMGMSHDPRADRLHFLVRTDADRPFFYGFVRSPDPRAAFHELARRGGEICGYAQRASRFVGREHLFVVSYDPRHPTEHDLISGVPVAELPETFAKLAVADWRVAGLAHEDDAHVTLVVKRPLVVEVLTPQQLRPMGVFNASASSVQSALNVGDVPRAQAALQALSGAPPSTSLWAEHREALGEALDILQSQPWVGAAQLAELALQVPLPYTARGKIFASTLEKVTYEALRRELTAARIAGLCEAAHATALSPGAEAWLLQRLVGAAQVARASADLSTATQLLPHLVQHEAIGAATVLMALGADADAAVEGAKSARRLAVESGIPALSEALEGNVHAAAEWARLGDVQRKAIVTTGKQAVAKSDAAAPKLLAKLAKLGLDDGDALTLRRYVTRHAPLWINFHPHVSNGLLGDVAYRPRGVGRARYAGAYEQSGETRVIYSWLNAVDAMDGFIPFGLAALELQNKLRARATLMRRQDSVELNHAGTFHAMDHLLLRMSDATLQAMHAAAMGDRTLRPVEVEDAPGSLDFMEVHVHGPLILRDDVRAIRLRAVSSLDPASLAKLQAFAERNGLPIEWHAYAFQSASQLGDAIDVASAVGVDIAAHAHSGGGNTVLLAQPPAIAKPGSYAYAFHSESFDRAKRLVELLGRDGMDIVGLKVDPGSNQVAKRGQRRIEVLARRDAADSTPRTYLWQPTQHLAERLQHLESNGWQVVAYQEGRAAGQSTPEHFLIARADDDAHYAHQVMFEQGSTDQKLRHQVNARVESMAERGRKLAGMHLDGKKATLIFKKSAALADNHETFGTPDTPDDAEFSLMGEPLASLPEALRVKVGRRTYDVEELAAFIASKGRFVDELNLPFSDADIHAIIRHPSGAGTRLASMAGDTLTLQRQVRPATLERVREVVAALRADATEGSLPQTTLALDAFRRHVASCSPQEQVALDGAQFTCRDTRGAAFTTTLMGAMAGLQTREGCSRATAGYLEEMVRAVEAARAQ